MAVILTEKMNSAKSTPSPVFHMNFEEEDTITTVSDKFGVILTPTAAAESGTGIAIDCAAVVAIDQGAIPAIRSGESALVVASGTAPASNSSLATSFGFGANSTAGDGYAFAANITTFRCYSSAGDGQATGVVGSIIGDGNSFACAALIDGINRTNTMYRNTVAGGYEVSTSTTLDDWDGSTPDQALIFSGATGIADQIMDQLIIYKWTGSAPSAAEIRAMLDYYWAKLPTGDKTRYPAWG